MSLLTERISAFAEAWRPTQAGDRLIGAVVDRDSRDSEYGEPYEILTVRTEAEDVSLEDGKPLPAGVEKSWHGFHTMSRREIARWNPQPGERVGIAYHGKGEAVQGMNPPERIKLVVDGRLPGQQPAGSTLDPNGSGPDPNGQPEGSLHGESQDDDVPF